MDEEKIANLSVGQTKIHRFSLKYSNINQPKSKQKYTGIDTCIDTCMFSLEYSNINQNEWQILKIVVMLIKFSFSETRP